VRKLPIEVVARIKELHGTPRPDGSFRTFADITHDIRSEFPGSSLSLSSVSRVIGRSAAPPKPAPAPTEVTEWEPTRVPLPDAGPFQWSKHKAEVLLLVAGLARASFQVAADAINKNPTLAFRDAAEAIKAATALVELAGKLNSGRYDVAEEGDALSPITAIHIEHLVLALNQPGVTIPVLAKRMDAIAAATEEPDADD
jgi:hypothetical protein